MVWRSKKRKTIYTIAFLLVAFLGFHLRFLLVYPEPRTAAQRFESYNFANLPVKEPVELYFDDHMTPFIVARTDADAAVVFGAVTAFLRMGQLEMMKRVAYGRLSETAGPFTEDIDHIIRLLNFKQTAQANYELLSEPDKTWVTNYTRGINHYLNNSHELPIEYRFLNLTKEEFTVYDIMTLGRLAGVDISIINHIMAITSKGDRGHLWRQMVQQGLESTTSIDPHSWQGIFAQNSKSGSNSYVIGTDKSSYGAPIIANDPHVGLSLPPLWMLVGIKSPSYHMVGFTIPGLPFIGVGRNQTAAWGGTNMRSSTSDFYTIDCQKDPKLHTRTETIKMRWWFDQEIAVREHELGVVVSDAELLEPADKKTIVMRSLGQKPSNELGAFLKAARANSFNEFRLAFKTYAVSGQNLLYADKHGNIGQVLAVRVPARKAPPRYPSKDGCSPDADYDQIYNSTALPFALNPAEGFIASANNRPVERPYIGFFFSANDRIERLRQLLGQQKKFSFEDMKLFQRDVYSASSQELALEMAAFIERANLERALKEPYTLLKNWDGFFTRESKAASLVNMLAEQMIHNLYSRERAKLMLRIEQSFEMLTQELKNPKNQQTLKTVFLEIADKEIPRWHKLHRQRAGHLLSNIPVIGNRFTAAEYGTAGSRTTLMKTSHNITSTQHYTSYGANARHISLLHDIDENYFVLFGGNDGWVHSESFADQVELFKQSKYLKIPLSIKKVKQQFSRKIVIHGR